MAESNMRSRQQVLAISGMTCGGCVKRVEQALLRVPGVDSALVNLSAGQAVVDGSASTDALVGAVEAAGYGARPIETPAGMAAADSRHGRGCC